MVLLPTVDGLLLNPASLVFEDGTSDDDAKGDRLATHADVPKAMAQHFGVPLLSELTLARNSDEFGEQFDVQVDVVNLLRQTLEDYGQDGSPVFKELLQNASDAGASEVTVMLDRRQYGKERLLTEGLAAAQGPALMFINNSSFTDEDLSNIRKYASRAKAADPTKLGKYGIGFSTVFSVTDVPMFTTRGSLHVFDPCCTHLGSHVAGKGSGNGRKFNLKLAQQHPDSFAFLDAHNIDPAFTCFRLPLRCAKSRLCPRVANVDELGRTLHTFADTAAATLLFLPSITKLTFVEFNEDGEQVWRHELRKEGDPAYHQDIKQQVII